MNKAEIENKLRNKIVVVDHEKLNLEINSFPKKIFDLFFIPILNILPKSSRGLIRKSNKAVNEIVINATNHDALEVLYSKGLKHSVNNIFGKIAHTVWFNTNNSKGVRNRLQIVKHHIKQSLTELINNSNSEINIVSIAAGSSRAVVEALELINTDKIINVYFVDKNPNALTYSQNLIKSREIYGQKNFNFSWQENTVNGFLDSNNIKFDLVEMVGLMDYFEDERAITIFNKIYNTLNIGGYFITANINHNKEKRFVTNAIGWPMIYRSAEHIARLVHESNFTHDSIEIYYEPLKIHSIIIAKK